MNLKQYLHSTMKDGETYVDRYQRFADGLGVSLHTVRKWVNGQRRIKDHMKLEIQKRSGSLVKLADMVKTR